MIMQGRIRRLNRRHQAAIAKLEKEAAANHAGLEQLLAELRLERRRFLRRMASPRGYDTTVLTMERLYFRQVPITGWMQEEIPLGGGEELSEQTVLIREIAGPEGEVGAISLVPA
jgi:hypothetical protein